MYGRPEDEFFHKRAAWSATFPVAERPVAKDELRQLRLVMLIEANQARRHRVMVRTPCIIMSLTLALRLGHEPLHPMRLLRFLKPAGSWRGLVVCGPLENA